MTDTKTELTIADEIVDMAADALRGYQIAESDLIDAGSEVLQAAGPALVAAELRRLADEDAFELGRLRHTASLYSNGLPPALQPMFDRYHTSMMRLRSRADELDRPES